MQAPDSARNNAQAPDFWCIKFTGSLLILSKLKLLDFKVLIFFGLHDIITDNLHIPLKFLRACILILIRNSCLQSNSGTLKLHISSPK